MKTTICRYCGEDYPMKRFDLGYLTCLDCGDIKAQEEKAFKAKCTAPAYNKSAYFYVSSKEQVVGVFKCGSNK